MVLFAKCDTFCEDNIISLEKLFVISMEMVAVPPKTVNAKAAEKCARKWYCVLYTIIFDVTCYSGKIITLI